MEKFFKKFSCKSVSKEPITPTIREPGSSSVKRAHPDSFEDPTHPSLRSVKRGCADEIDLSSLEADPRLLNFDPPDLKSWIRHCQQQLMGKAEELLRESRAAVNTIRHRLGINKADNLSKLYGLMVLNAVHWDKLDYIPEVYDLCKSQEIFTQDGTTTVALIGHELLQQVVKEGISPKVICKILPKAAEKAIDLLIKMAVHVDVREDRKSLRQSTITAIENRVDPNYMGFVAEIAVDAASFVDDPIKDIFFLEEYVGGSIDQTKFIEGYPFIQRFGVPMSESFSSSSSIRIALIDFDILSDLRAHGLNLDHPIAKEVIEYAHELIRLLKESGVNVVVIDMSRLADFATIRAFELIVHRGGIHVLEYISDVSVVSLDFISKALNCRPIGTTDDFKDPLNFGQARSIEELKLGDYTFVPTFVQIIGIKWNKDRGRIGSIIFRGFEYDNDYRLYLPYALNIALGNLATLFKMPNLIPGGGAPHIQLSVALSELMDKKEKEIGTDKMEHVKCVRLFAKALEVIPWTLARNVGLDPATTVTELKNDHKLGLINAGINTSKGHTSTDMLKEGVVHPLLLLTNAIKLATEFVCEQFKSM